MNFEQWLDEQITPHKKRREFMRNDQIEWARIAWESAFKVKYASGGVVIAPASAPSSYPTIRDSLLRSAVADNTIAATIDHNTLVSDVSTIEGSKESRNGISKAWERLVWDEVLKTVKRSDTPGEGTQ